MRKLSYYDKDGAKKRAFDRAFDLAFQKKDFTKLDTFLKNKNNKKYINMLYHGHTVLGRSDGRKDLIKYLIDHGADITLKDFRGYTALDNLLRNPCRKYGEVVPCSTLEYNPKEDRELIKLLGGNDSTKAIPEPDIQYIEGHAWEYVKSYRYDDTRTMQSFNKAKSDDALKYCNNLEIEGKKFRIPKCTELASLSKKEKTIPFVYNGIFFSNGAYIDFHKTPDLVPYVGYVCIDQKEKMMFYKFSTKKIEKYSGYAIVKCIEDE